MGTVVISIDAELGWGHHDLRSPPVERVEYARTGWRRLAALHDEFELPATWGVVGHLLLDECDGVHAGHPTPDGWFAREWGSWDTRPDLRFGRDLVDLIVESDVEHELACHSFSHVLFDGPETTAAVARAELRACQAALDRYPAGPDAFDSFVFPRNRIGHRAVLADEGYRCYRGETLGPAQGMRALAPLRKVAAALARRPPPLVEPRVDEYGLVNLPSSMYLFGFEGVPKAVWAALDGDPLVARAKRGVDRAAAEGGVFHLWLHPNNLVSRADGRRVRAIYRYLRTAVDAGRVTVEPMRAVAASAATAVDERPARPPAIDADW